MGFAQSDHVDLKTRNRLFHRPLGGPWLAAFGLVGAVFWLSLTHAKPLATYDLVGAQRIAVLQTDFDPPTQDHQRQVDQTLKSGFDAVLVVPTADSTDPMALPAVLRLNLLELHFRSQTRVLVPSQTLFTDSLIGSKGQIDREIRRLNPKAEVTWLNPTPVSDPVPAIRDRFQLYFESGIFDSQCPPELSPSVCKEIFKQGYYIGRDPHNRIEPISSPLGLIKRGVVVTTNRLGLGRLRSHLVRKIKEQTNLSGWVELPTFSGGKVRILRRLGHGSFASAYLVERGGRKMVLSYPHRGERFQKVLASRIETALWVERFSGAAIARLAAFDRQGRWALSEFVEGPSLREKIEAGEMESLIANSSLQNLFLEFRRLQDEKGIFLDLTPANVIFQNGERAILVDLGQMPQPRWSSLASALKDWQREIRNSGSWLQRARLRTCEAALRD